MNVSTRVLLLSLLSIAVAVPVFAEDILYSVSSRDDQLRVVDPTDASTLSMVTITIGGSPIVKSHGLATHPTTQELWALVQTGANGDPRLLVTINKTTGVATVVGDTGDLFTGLAFTTGGTLYAINGSGSAMDPDALAILSTLDGSPTFVLNPANGSGAQNIAYHPGDGFLYHFVGFDINKLFEKIHLGSLADTPIPLSGTGFTLGRGLTYESSGNFLLAMFASGGPTKPGGAEEFLTRLTDAGNVSLIGALDHVSRGLAFASLPVPVERTSWGRLKGSTPQ